jgi:hypothetical protein
MKNFLIIPAFLLTVMGSYAQNPDELKSLNAKAKFQFVTPENLDRIMAGMRMYETQPVAGQDSLMIDTYNAAINGYMVNNHFKQAYETFNRYLLYKENMLTKRKQQAIAKANESVSARQSTDDKTQVDLQNNLSKLMSENITLDTRRISFKRNFSFALILLSAIFAIMLVSGGIKLLNLRTELATAQNRMKSIHRSSVSGNLSPGLLTALTENPSNASEQSRELFDKIKKHEGSFVPAKKALPVISAIEKSLKDILKKLKAS